MNVERQCAPGSSWQVKGFSIKSKHLKNYFSLVILSPDLSGRRIHSLNFFSKRWILRRPDSIGTPQNDKTRESFRSLRSIIVLFLFLFPVHLSAQWLDDSISDGNVQRGIEHVYNLQFDDAENDFREIVLLHPSHPTGYFFLAMVDWWRIVIDIDNEGYDKRFVRKLNRVISICDSILDKKPNDVAALFFKGGSLGFRGRLRANREQWLDAANDGREALPIVQRAYKLAPQNNDILLGIGIYNYYASVIPEQYPIVKPLMIFFPGGNRKLGIEQLTMAGARAQYAAIEARYVLLQLYYSYEHQYPIALETSERLFARFPRNVVFHRYVGRCFVNLGRWNEACAQFSEIAARCGGDSSVNVGYGNSALREATYYLGLCAMNRAAFGEAIRSMLQCENLSRQLDGKDDSGFRILANLKLGMLYDLRAQRDSATLQYQRVLKLKEYQQSHELAKRYLKTPYAQ
jgi:tetratricopeptide (TPR) repeat protein